MKTQSAKAKGRKLQQWVRDTILKKFPFLTKDDVRSTSMGAGGEDIQLSPKARKYFPFSIECKSRKALAIYNYYQQAEDNSKNYEPLLIVKMNNKKPLAVLDAEAFVEILEDPYA